MFIRKIRQCCVVFDFTDVINLAQAEQKEIKRETLLELVEFVLTDKLPFSPIMYKAVIAMVRFFSGETYYVRYLLICSALFLLV